MFSMIICEGKTDAILMSYFLYKKYGVTFSKSNPPIRLPIEPQNQIIEWYSKKENSKPSIAIWGVGGVDMIKAALSDVLEINKEEANKELRFDKIVIYFDTDDREQKDNDELFRRWLEYAGFDNDEKDEAKLGNWFKRSITLAGSNTNKFFIDIFGLALPPDGKGALETFLLDCLKKRSGEDKDIVEGAREYIDKLKEVSYLNKRRFPEKAALGSVLSVLSPDWIFTVMDEKLKSIEWEKITDFLDSYQKLGRLVSVE